ncbi:serine/threonine-protein kinase [Ramlibacter sp.]|uniref:serine/threonine-protein kinase n=1 Tax=Ramlibacter sp. TaxID=1917967 RepID=UPI0035AFD9F2
MIREPSPLAGRVAGYAIEGIAGRGRGSVVYIAREPRLARRVALKVATQRQLLAARGESDFARESAAAAAASHPGLLRVWAHGTAGDSRWLASEHAAGGSLAAIPLPLAPARVHAFLLQAAEALAALHAAGWVHRDVKPANLLLRADGSLALADFGCAAPAGTAVPPGRLVGSPAYAAPEQLRGAPAAPSADIHALGAVAFQLLTARLPCSGETLQEIAAQHLCAPLPSLPPALAAWQPLLHALLARDPSARIADGPALVQRLRREERLLLHTASPCSRAGAGDLP